MNYIIVGLIINLIGGVITVIGTTKQYRKDDVHKLKVEGFISEQVELDQPKLEVVGSQGYSIKVKNVGTRSAEKVKLFVEEINGSSLISNFNTITGLSEMVRGTEYKLDLNPFSGIDLINKMPETEESLLLKEEANKLLSKFHSGDSTLFVRFYLEFYYEGDRKVSDTYTISIDNSGPFSLSKD